MNRLAIAFVLIAISDKLIPAQVSFAYPVNLSMGAAINSLVSGDLNNDGRGDFAVTYGNTSAAIFLGHSDGTVTRTDLALPPNVAQSTFIAFADVNGDHNLDLLGKTGVGLNYFVMPGHGDGTFDPPIPFQAAGAVLGVADFNHDRFGDLLVEYHETDVVPKTGFAVQLGHGDGSFGDIGPHYISSNIASGVSVGDLNGDGLPDIVWPTSQNITPNVWLGNGDGSFRQIGETSPNFPFYYATGVIGDVDGDGQNDFVFQQGQSIQIFLGDGTGRLRVGGSFIIGPWLIPSRSVLDPSLGPLWPSNSVVSIADFAGAGKVDIEGYSYVLRGAGDGTFGLPTAFGQLSQGVIVLDVNGDGKADLVGVGPASDTISILINSSSRSDASVPAYLAAAGDPYLRSLAPGAIASIYGTDLTQDHSTEPLALPTVFGNTSVEIVDAAQTRFLARLLYVSPSQINFLVPDGVASGFAIINVLGNGRARGAHSTMMQPVAPAFFTLGGTSSGSPVASAISVDANGTQTPIQTASCTPDGCTALPIPVSTSGQVFLSLYGTGFRHAISGTCSLGQSLVLGFESVGINYQEVTPSYFGPQSTTSLIDQINIPIPAMYPKGKTSITCMFGGPSFARTPTVTVMIQ